jgi:hypothetical protein
MGRVGIVGIPLPPEPAIVVMAHGATRAPTERATKSSPFTRNAYLRLSGGILRGEGYKCLTVGSSIIRIIRGRFSEFPIGGYGADART